VTPTAFDSFEFVVAGDQAGQRLVLFLVKKDLPYSRAQLTRRIDEGEVHVDGKQGKPGQKLRPGQRVRFTPPPPRSVADRLLAQAIPLEILYEDRHLLVVNKPAGMVVHPAPGHETGTLVNALLHHCGALPAPLAYPGRDDASQDETDDDSAETPDEISLSIGGEQRPGIVHRLDQGTSGVIVCAKDEPTLLGLQAQFQVHSIARRYLALVEGVLPARGTFDTRYGRHPHDRKRFSGRGGSKRAVTHYTVQERLPGATLVEARLETGRTHQIRVHFSEAGHPLLGDPLYGRPPRQTPLLSRRMRDVSQALGHQALHARLLGFVHPMVGSWLEFSAPLPADFRAALTGLRAPKQALDDRPADEFDDAPGRQNLPPRIAD
jgi:23S rRNA pseudouridine1911/1915/1917 synthase